MEQIPIKHLFATVDDQDRELVSGYRWYLHASGNTVYARGYKIGNRNGGLIYMHRLISGAATGFDVDHRNGNGLDNQRANLRVCSRSQNNANRHVIVSASGITGVHFEQWSGKWRAEIRHLGKRYRLGRFSNQQDAADAYAAKALLLFGEFASAKKHN
jgi:hypothetical protein